MRGLLFVSMLCLLVGVAGCDNVDSEGATSGPGDGTPGDGDDDDDDDGSGNYEPGPIPETLGGMAVFVRSRDRSVGDLAGIYEDFTGMVNFFPVPVPVPPTLQEVWDDFPDMPMDTCKRVYPSSVSLSTNIDPPNAGVITMEGPNGSITLSMLMGVGMYLSIWNDPHKFVPLADYTLKATGAQIGAFQIPFHSPGVITSLTPDITATTPFQISRTEPLPITWESIKDGRPIFLSMTQKDQPDQTEWIWMCKMTDDGAFEVPVEMLSDFGPTVTPFVTEEWRDKMDLRRWHYSSFTAPGAVGPIISAFESGWYSDIQFQ